jgi:hypothetical protein
MTGLEKSQKMGNQILPGLLDGLQNVGSRKLDRRGTSTLLIKFTGPVKRRRRRREAH